MAEGHNFRAVVAISDVAGAVVAAIGETCDRVDPAALGWLQACGAIVLDARSSSTDAVAERTPSVVAAQDEV